MNKSLEPKIFNFFVANLRNSWLLRAICALNLNILNLNLFRPDLIRGSLAVLVIIFLPIIPEPANAIDWDHLWTRADQRAAEQLQTQDNQQPPPSPALFKEPEWQAAASYRAGDYQKTIETLEGLETSDALYNAGNALAKMGNLPDAIKAYDKVIKNNPAHEDAKYNRDLVKKKLEEQQQSSDQKKDGDQKKDSEDQKKSDQNQSSDSQSSDKQSSEKKENNKDGKEQQEQDQQQQEKSNKGDDPSEQEQKDAGSDQKENKDASEEERKQAEQEAAKKEQREKKQQEKESTLTQGEPQEEKEQTEAEQANEQWLRRIPDDPGGLLRRKFQYEHQRRLQKQMDDGQVIDQTNNGKQAW